MENFSPNFSSIGKGLEKGELLISVSLKNYIGILLGYPPESCEQSGICSIQCVAEADGGAYPCDFYVLGEYRLGNYNEDGIQDFFAQETAWNFVQESTKHAEECRHCQWYSLCRNGCRRHRIRDEKNRVVQKLFL